jgi:hypothetical protein
VKNKRKAVTHFLIAALLIWSAAICTAAQSKAKKNKAESQPALPLPSKQNSRETSGGQSTGDAPEKSSKSSATDAGTAPSSSTLKSEAVEYSFEFTQPNFLESHILITHDENGRGDITFERRNSDPICDPLVLSQATVARLKTLWDTLHFLDSEKSYQSEKDYPHLGTNRLHMKQGTRDRLAEFNWTGDKDAFALITEYKRIANQAIFIFDITLSRENQPLNSPKLMDEFDDHLRRNEFADPQQLLPLLRELSTDERLPLIARNHAGRLVKKIEK